MQSSRRFQTSGAVITVAAIAFTLVALPLCAPAAVRQSAPTTGPADSSPVTFNTHFEGGSLGRVEKLSPTEFRCHVEGQHDERGRNHQASWYYFRMDNVRGRDLTVTLTDFVGEYNDKPGACPA